MKFDRFINSDRKYDKYLPQVEIGKSTYEMFFQRDITGAPDDIKNTLCVNCFQFIPIDGCSKGYILTLGYDGEYGCYSVTFDREASEQLIYIDDIHSNLEELPFIKKYFEKAFDGRIRCCTKESMNAKFEDIREILNDLFDYCYEYLVKNGFHIADLENH